MLLPVNFGPLPGDVNHEENTKKTTHPMIVENKEQVHGEDEDASRSVKADGLDSSNGSDDGREEKNEGL